MESETPPPQKRSSSVGVLVVIGALVGFVGLLFMANVQTSTTVGPSAGPVQFKSKEKGKGKRKAKTSKTKTPKRSSGADRVPPEQLLRIAPAYDRPAAPPDARNVVVVVPTSIRRDHVSPYGADPALTPFLQEVADHGARFEDLVSVGPLGRYAATAMLTGQVPAVVDMQDPGEGADAKVLAADITTLPELLRDAGWRTYGVTANFHLNSASGLAQGFDVYRDTQPDGFAPDARLEGPEAVQAALSMLRVRTPEDAARPFYLQVDLVDAHAPLHDFPEIVEQFDPKKPGASYRAAVHRTDQYVADLWHGLAEFGADPANTFLVVVGDHGEGISQPAHHGKAHGRYLYGSAVDVAWLVEGPGVPQNHVVQGLASTTDVFPTVLELLGRPIPEGIDGHSWAAQILGRSDRTTRDRAFSDTWFADVSRASVRTDRMECQKDFGSKENARDTFVDGCFDLKTDPDFRDVKTDEALMAELVAWRTETSSHVTRGAALSTQGPSEGEEASP